MADPSRDRSVEDRPEPHEARPLLPDAAAEAEDDEPVVLGDYLNGSIGQGYKWNAKDDQGDVPAPVELTG